MTFIESAKVKSDQGDDVYSLNFLKNNYEVHELDEGYLVLEWHDPNSKSWLKFAALDFYCSNGSDINLSLVFYGEGPSGDLRECRHTYWGEDGYLFYPNKKVISSALTALSEFFDLN